MTKDLAPCPELKVCPFCGGEPVTSTYYLECNGSACLVEPKLEWAWFRNREDAIRTWNTRASTPAPDLGVAVAALRRIKAKLQTGPTTQSVIMDAWDNAKEWVLECPTGTLPREIFEGAIEEFVDDIDEALKSLGGE